MSGWVVLLLVVVISDVGCSGGRIVEIEALLIIVVVFLITVVEQHWQYY